MDGLDQTFSVQTRTDIDLLIKGTRDLTLSLHLDAEILIFKKNFDFKRSYIKN